MKKDKLIFSLVLLVVVIMAGIFWKSGAISFAGGDAVKAVFLANGQVYFGKVSNQNSQFLSLTDIFYLQVSQTLQPPQSGSQPQQKIDLVKLGNELHGPQDLMEINRDQILFIEKLRDDSKILKAIHDFKNPCTTGQPTN